MLDLLNGFVVELRNAGLPVSLTENLDAMEAVQHIPIEDREAFKYALGATLIKNHAHWRSFETVFEVYFSLRGPEYKLVQGGDDDTDIDELWRELQEQQQQEGQGGAGGMDNLTPEEIAQMLMSALMNGDQGMMRAMAKRTGDCSLGSSTEVTVSCECAKVIIAPAWWSNLRGSTRRMDPKPATTPCSSAAPPGSITRMSPTAKALFVAWRIEVPAVASFWRSAIALEGTSLTLVNVDRVGSSCDVAAITTS